MRLGYAPSMVRSRRLLSAELLSVGSELTVGETRDTNSGELARSLTELGVAVGRIQALPDDLAVVAAAFREALARADLVVSTGGLGPTPDDLTREAIAAVAGEVPAVDPDLEAWLRGLWTRRGIPMPELNLKQAWRIPSATTLPNANGTAPGWWVERPDGQVVVALPGPPREMRPIWSDAVVPRLRERGVGAETARHTLRLAGIGESAVADILGEALLRAVSPVVATYARADAVDVRISAAGPGASDLVAITTERVRASLAEHVWADGETSWADAIGTELEARGWTLASVEVGSGGSLATLLADRPWLRRAEVLAAPPPSGAGQGRGDRLEALVRGALAGAGTADGHVGVGLLARSRGGDTAVSVVVVRPGGVHRERRVVFLDGAMGRSRSGLAAAAILLAELRRAGPPAGA